MPLLESGVQKKQLNVLDQKHSNNQDLSWEFETAGANH